MVDPPEISAAVLEPRDGARPFRVHHQDPSPGAADVVHHLWAVEWDLPDGATHTQEVVTFPCHHLTVEPDGRWVHGVVTRRFTRTLSGAGRAVGAHLRVPGLAALVGALDAATTTDRVLPADELLADTSGLAAVESAADAAAACSALDRTIARLHRHRVPSGDTVERGVELATDDPTVTRVDQLAGLLDLTPRTLQRHFSRVLGVGPKWVVRRARIHDALEHARDGSPTDWAALATALGFADQAHFTNTFTQVVGAPPARYAERGRR